VLATFGQLCVISPRWLEAVSAICPVWFVRVGTIRAIAIAGILLV